MNLLTFLGGLFCLSLCSCGSVQEQLEEKSEALEAASRLSEQLDRKEEMIHALREEGNFLWSAVAQR